MRDEAAQQEMQAGVLAAVLVGQAALGACAESGTEDDRLLETPAAERELVTTIDSLLHGSSNGVVAYNSTVDGGIVLMDPNTGRKELLTRHGPAGGFAQGRPDRVQPSG